MNVSKLFEFLRASEPILRSPLRSATMAATAAMMAVVICPPMSEAQGGYSYSWGGGRVVNGDQSGLTHPSGSYIGPGTMSQSAKGVYGMGAQTNPGLPRVNMGANVATPGDNMYGQNPTRVNNGAPMQGGSNPGLPSTRLGANVGTAGDSMRSDLNGPNQVRKEVFKPRYIGAGASQVPPGEAQTQTPVRMAPGGVATYDDVQLKQGVHY